MNCSGNRLSVRDVEDFRPDGPDLRLKVFYEISGITDLERVAMRRPCKVAVSTMS